MRYGLETVEFQVAANPGVPPRSLAKVASGGELSRISLAIQVAASQVASVPTLIFDEVDSGIGGRVAEIVGGLLKQAGQALSGDVRHPSAAGGGDGGRAVAGEQGGEPTASR